MKNRNMIDARRKAKKIKVEEKEKERDANK